MMKIFAVLILYCVGFCRTTDFEDLFKRTFNQQKCDELGGPKTWKAVTELPPVLAKCYTQNFMNDWQDQLNQALKSKNYRSLAKKHCLTFSDVRKCILSSVKVAVSPCLTNEEKQELETWYGTSKEAFDYVCHNEGEELEKIWESTITSCMTVDHKKLVKKCFEEYVTVTENIGVLNMINLEDSCSQFKKMEDCYLRDIRLQCDQESSTKLEPVLKIFRKAFC